MNDARHMKLSDAQKAFLREFAFAGQNMPPSGYATAGRDASRWHRTCGVLMRLGLVTRGHYGPAYLTWRGLAVTVALLNDKE